MRLATDPRRALTHPLWWAALVVLLLNDHLLKGAGVLPGWVTGKVSDLAGLIVAPVLAAAALRARTPCARALAFALPVVPFVAINISPAAAGATEAAMAAVGVPWRIWTDPTDLLALAVLPVAWWVAARGDARAGRRAVEGVALGLGAFACVATSPAPGGLVTADTYVVNHTEGTVDLRLRWAEGRLSCDAIAGTAVEALSPDVFDDGLTFRLEPNAVAPLDHASAMTASGSWDSEREVRPGCDAVLVEADGLPRHVVFWRAGSMQTLSGSIEPGGDLPSRGLRILPEEGELLRVDSRDLEVGAAQERTAASACASGEVSTYEWSVADLPSLGAYRLADAARGPDGCWQLDLLDDLDGTAFRAFLCVPEWSFPFGAGDLLRIHQREALEGTAAPELRITREHGDGSFGDELLVTRSEDAVREGPVSGRLSTADCGGDRVECGAYVAPAQMVLEDGTRLSPGDTHGVGHDADGRRVTVGLGRAESVLVSHPECAPVQGQLGEWADVVVLYEEVIE